MNRVLCVVIIALLVACGALSLGLNHYRDNAITYKAQRDKNVLLTEGRRQPGFSVAPVVWEYPEQISSRWSDAQIP